MTKSELIDKMATDSDISKAAAGKALDSFIDGIKKTLKKGNKVTLVGFGTFSVGKRAARKGRNPRQVRLSKLKHLSHQSSRQGKPLRMLSKYSVLALSK